VLKGDIAELQRFMPMYTTCEPFTDRVFLYAITNAAICYTGGHATRNKYNHTHAASWEGFSTDYAAMVLQARRNEFRALVYNFADEPLTGRVRLWTLDHGMYELTVGTDADGDDEIDAAERTEQLEITRATPVQITLAPKAVTVLELKQLEQLDDIRLRPDLAIAAREISVENRTVSGIVHNIGGSDAPEFTVALVDAEGNAQATAKLGTLAAPVDLEPKRLEVRIDGVPADATGWRLVVDPDDAIAEVFEGNNAVEL
jgi:hypothetical protein